MKILIKGPADNAHVYRWALALINRGHQVTVFSSVYGEIPCVKIVLFTEKKTNYLLKIIKKIDRILQFRKLIREFKPEIVHIHYLAVGWAELISIIGIKNLIISVWGSDIIFDNGKEPLKLRIYKYFLLNRARYICATTHFLAKETKKYLQKKKTINVIPFGVDTKLLKNLNNKKRIYNKSKIKIGFVKHLQPKYGPHVLLVAFKKVVNEYPNVELIIVGKGYLENKLKNMAINLKIENKVKFLGYYPQNKIKDVYLDIDIFVMPSKSEAFGVAAIESQSMEIPVVASRIGGIPEAVQDGITGILVKPGDSDELADELMRLIKNDEMRFKMGVNGRKFVKKNYEWANNVDQMEKIYFQCIKNNI